MDVQVSPVVCWYIRRRGSQFYIWTKPFGGTSGAALLRHTIRRPPAGIEFSPFEHDGLTVWFERGFDLGRVEIRLSIFGIDVSSTYTIAGV
jgi:hypothetical protein